MEVNEQIKGSECAPEYIDHADESGRVPFHSDSAVHLIVPVAGAAEVEPTVGLLHDDTVGDELEVFIHVRDSF